MKKIITLALIIAAMVSCSENDNEETANLQADIQNACTAENPLELKWMQDFIAELECGKYSCRVSIIKTTYEGETVFYKQMTDPICNGVDEIDLYNCVGEVIEEFDVETSREFLDNNRNESEEIFFCNE